VVVEVGGGGRGEEVESNEGMHIKGEL